MAIDYNMPQLKICRCLLLNFHFEDIALHYATQFQPKKTEFNLCGTANSFFPHHDTSIIAVVPDPKTAICSLYRSKG